MYKKSIISIMMVLSMIFMLGCQNNTIIEDNVYNENNGINKESIEGYIVKNNVSDYSIVYANNGNECEIFSANELRSYVKKITGVSLKVISERFTKITNESKYIFVGKTDSLSNLKIYENFESLNNDGFIIKNYGSNLFICGSNNRGTIYGIYDFLEKICGVKFIAYDYTYIPVLNEIPLYKMNVIEKPYFKYRTFLSQSIDSSIYSRVNFRFNDEFGNIGDEYGGVVPYNKNYKNEGMESNFTHNSLMFVPPNIYFTENNKAINAHLYNLDNEGNIIDINYTDGITEDGKIDNSKNVSTIKIAIEYCKKFVKESKVSDIYFMFGQQDRLDCFSCNCSSCVAVKEKYGISGMLIRFANLLAEEVQKYADENLNNKKINIVIFAYGLSEAPPTSTFNELTKKYELIDQSVKAKENVVVRIATMGFLNPYYSMADERQAARYQNFLEKWKLAVDQIWLWNYHTIYSYYFGYYNTTSAWQQDLNLFKKYNVDYVFYESDHTNIANWMATMNTYIASKMLWNPNRDVVKLRNEFIHYYYGDLIEDIIKNLIDEFDEKLFILMESGKFDKENAVYTINSYNYENWSKEFLNKQINSINNAINIINASNLNLNDKIHLINKIECIKLTPLYTLLVNYDYYYSNDNQGKLKIAKELIRIGESNNVRSFGTIFGYNTLENIKYKFNLF